MPLFNFEAEFKLGIEEIDAEHAGLVKMLNEVHNLIHAGEKEKAREYFRETLAAYVGQHFTNEEKFLYKIGYPELDDHKKIHANFRQAMEVTFLKIDTLDETAFRNALSDTFTWIINHIGKTDRKYAVFYLAKQTA